nr:hypothetical protein [Tanacetum cinerariifolium]
MRGLVMKYKAEKVCHEEMVKMPLVDLKVLEVYTKSKEEHELHLKMNLELLKKKKHDVRTLIIEEAHAMKYYVHPGAEIRGSKMIGLETEQETTKLVVIKERLKEAKDYQERVKLIIIKDVSTVEPVTATGEVVTTTTIKDSAALSTDVTKDEISMAQALAALKSIKPKVMVQEQEMSTIILVAVTTVITVVPTPRAKGIVFHKQKQSKIPIVYSIKDKGKAKMIKPEVPIKKKDQMRIDEELQAREREEFSKVQKARVLVELIEKRKKHFAALRAQEKRNKPPTKTQMKIQMSIYLKHLGGYKQSHLKGMSFDEIKKLFDREMRKVNDFIAIDSEAQESSTKRLAEHLESDISKKQKVDENVEPIIDDSKELKKYIEIVPDDGDGMLIKATPLSSRSSTIIDYKIHKKGKKTYFNIIIADVKDRFKKEKSIDDIDNLLFRSLKTMFEHHVEDNIWKYQQGLAKVYPLTRNTLHQLWSDVRLQVDYDVEMAYDLLRFHNEVFGYILLMKTKILIKKLEDLKDEYQV